MSTTTLMSLPTAPCSQKLPSCNRNTLNPEVYSITPWLLPNPVITYLSKPVCPQFPHLDDGGLELLCCACKAASRLSSRRDISSILANISLDTPANLFDNELRRSSTTAVSSSEDYTKTRSVFGCESVMRRCSHTLPVPADGSWLGVSLFLEDIAGSVAGRRCIEWLSRVP